jgi:hypothetical protein
MDLKYEIKSVIMVEYGDLDEFLTERFNLPEDYEFAAMEELGNDVVDSINVCKEEIGSYDQEYIDAVIKDKKPRPYGTRMLLCYLCNLGEIPEGKYMINVSW